MAWFTRRSKNAPTSRPLAEALENRTLLAATTPARVTTAYLDNRGTATFTFSAPLKASTLNANSASIYTAGKDGKLATADDVRVKTTVKYTSGTLTLSANVKLNQGYRVLLNGNLIKGTNGKTLDGEFKGANVPSGNGKAGGNYDVVAKAPKKTVYRFSVQTAPGVTSYINVAMFSDTPNTLANFKHYANEGAWDTTFFHRSTTDADSGLQVIQGGGFNVNSTGSIGSVHSHTGVGLELTHSNLKGTIAMARTSDPNSNTNQWFFNVNDNAILDTVGGGYTVFGAVADAASQKTLETINNLAIRQGDPQNPNSPFNELPSLDATGQINVPNDLVLVTRVAVVMDVARGK